MTAEGSSLALAPLARGGILCFSGAAIIIVTPLLRFWVPSSSPHYVPCVATMAGPTRLGSRERGGRPSRANHGHGHSCLVVGRGSRVVRVEQSRGSGAEPSASCEWAMARSVRKEP